MKINEIDELTILQYIEKNKYITFTKILKNIDMKYYVVQKIISNLKIKNKIKKIKNKKNHREYFLKTVD